jgi:hypothetical protein
MPGRCDAAEAQHPESYFGVDGIAEE